MAHLVKCPKCGNNVSSEAKNCPKCNFDLKAPPPTPKSQQFKTKCPVCGADWVYVESKGYPKKNECSSCGHDVYYDLWGKGICPKCGNTTWKEWTERKRRYPMSDDTTTDTINHKKCTRCGEE